MINRNHQLSFMWILLNPAVLITIIIVISIAIWAITPDRIVYALVPKGRHVSATSFAYLIACLLMFWLGYFLIELKEKYDPIVPQRLLLSDMIHDPNSSEEILKSLKNVALFFIVVSLIGYLILLFNAFRSYGNLFEYIEEVYSGTQIGKLKRGVAGSRIGGITTLVFFTQTAAIISYIGWRASQRQNLSKYSRCFLFIIFFSLIPGLFSLFIIGGIRSQLLHVLIPLLVIHICYVANNETKVRVLFRYFLLVIGIIVTTYVIGDYFRNYLPHQRGFYSVGNIFMSKESVLFGALDNLSSYFFRSLNNCFVIVDNLDRHTFFYRTFNWAYTGFGLASLDPGGFIKSAREQMEVLESIGLAYFSASNSTIFGYYFIDLNWAAVCIFLVLGIIYGKLYRGLTQYSLISWLLYPSLMYGLTDCWRTAVLTKTPGMVPVFGLIFAYLIIRRRYPLYR